MAQRSRWRKPSRRFWRWVSVAVPIGVVVFLLAGFGDWIPVSISGQVWTNDHYCSGGSCALVPTVSESLPSGPSVTVRWADESGGVVVLDIWEPGTNSSVVPQCNEVGSNGACSFVSVGGNYTFRTGSRGSEGPQLVGFTLSYSISLL